VVWPIVEQRGTLAGPVRSDVELARDLVSRSRLATLSTFSLRPAGYPFGSLVAHSQDERGHPLLLLSALAEHTKNLAACDKASLLVHEPGATDIVEAPRVTLVGTCARVPSEQRDVLFARYVAAHPQTADWMSDHLHAYALYRLDPIEIRVIVGFGRLSWSSAEDYSALL